MDTNSEEFNEMRIANAFNSPSLLTADDIAEMQRRCSADNKEWKRRKSKTENAGEYIEGNKRRYQSKAVKPKTKKWMRRKLTEEEKDQLLRAWG